jgi:hypothetical protein
VVSLFDIAVKAFTDQIPAGMRRRLLIGSLLGLFTQWSGNTLISYYLDTILTQVGFTDPAVKGKLNVGLTCWNLVNATFLALFVTRFKRRKVYLACTVSLLVSALPKPLRAMHAKIVFENFC